ncbi:MAG: type III pantothenate kinase [bacterium]|nr:type III pantothenate kinase [Candidatus Kapabacteria bacterium]
MIYLELGNTTIKLAHDVGDDMLLLERFTSADALLKRIGNVDDRIVCAPIGQKHSEKLLRALSERDDTVIISPEMLSRFIGDSYDTPHTLGIDRVLNLMGLVADGVVISCGTAITVDMLVGGIPSWGAIMPGFTTAAEGLHERIPALPSVDIHHIPALPSRTTIDSVANGVIVGTVHAAQAIATDLSALAPKAQLTVVLTGGDAQILERLWRGEPKPVLDELLIFAGMAKIAAG